MRKKNYSTFHAHKQQRAMMSLGVFLWKRRRDWKIIKNRVIFVYFAKKYKKIIKKYGKMFLIFFFVH